MNKGSPRYRKQKFTEAAIGESLNKIADLFRLNQRQNETGDAFRVRETAALRSQIKTATVEEVRDIVALLLATDVENVIGEEPFDCAQAQILLDVRNELVTVDITSSQFINAGDAPSPLPETAREVNDGMPAFTVDKLLEGLNDTGTALSEATVVVLGLTYRAGVEEVRHTPSIPIVDRLVGQVAMIYVVHPVLEDLSPFDGARPIDQAEIESVDPDPAVLVTAHEEFEAIDWDGFERSLVVVDGRQALDFEDTNNRVYSEARGQGIIKLLTLVGTRLQFMKAFVVSRALQLNHDEVLVYTGQYYETMGFITESKRYLSRLYLSAGSRFQGTFIPKLPGISTFYNRLGHSTVLAVPSTQVTVRHSGSKLYIDPEDYVAQRLYKHGSYESQVTDTISKLLKKRQTAIDIGAHIGHHAVTMRQAVGDSGTVIAFEPFPENAELISETIRINDWQNVQLVQKAISDHSGEFEMIVPDEGNTGRAMDGRGRHGYEAKFKLKSDRLEDYLSQSGIDHIDLIKIDIEGGEYELLTDSRHILEKIDHMLIEIHATILDTDELGTVFHILNDSGKLVYHTGDRVTLQSLRSEPEKHVIWTRQ